MLFCLLFLVFPLDARKAGSTATTADIKKNAEVILLQSGLHLPPGASDLLDVIEEQSGRKECEIIGVKWLSLPGIKDAIPVGETQKLHLPQNFSVEESRKLTNCGRASYRAWDSDFLYFGLVVFRASSEGTIRGLQLTEDPRRFIIECPELFGQKSDPDTKCGAFIHPEISFEVHMPSEPTPTKLIFFLRVSDDVDKWHMERMGSVAIPVQ